MTTQTVAETIGILRAIRNDKIRDGCSLAVERGWRITYNGSGHIMLYPSNKQHSPVVVSATSAGSHRSYDNFRSELKKRGLRI